MYPMCVLPIFIFPFPNIPRGTTCNNNMYKNIFGVIILLSLVERRIL